MAKVFTIEQLIERITVQRDRLKTVIKIWRGVQQEVRSMRKSLLRETNVATNAETDLVAADAILSQFVTDMQALSFVNAYEVRPGKVVATTGVIFSHWNIDIIDGGNHTNIETQNGNSSAIAVLVNSGGTVFPVNGEKYQLLHPEDPESAVNIEIENSAGGATDPTTSKIFTTTASVIGNIGTDNLRDTKMFLQLVDK